MVQLKHGLVMALLLSTAAPALAQSRVLVFNTDASDPAPKAAFDQLIADLQAQRETHIRPHVHAPTGTFGGVQRQNALTPGFIDGAGI